MGWLRKGRALKVGLVLAGIWLVMTWVTVNYEMGSDNELLLLISGAVGLVGFGLMAISTFLPGER
jgi:hypothetical protein